MKELPTITDKIVFKELESGEQNSYQKRITVKAIVINKDEKIALITSDRHGLYLLPGGGAESDDLQREVSRECEEEINYSVTNIKELAMVSELRNRESKEYETTCFICDADNYLDEDTRTEDEKVNGLRVEWLSEVEVTELFTKQIEVLEKGEIDFYNIAFNVYRDSLFWSEYLSSTALSSRSQ